MSDADAADFYARTIAAQMRDAADQAISPDHVAAILRRVARICGSNERR